MNADAHPQSRRETVHTATVVNTRVSSHEGKDDDDDDSDASASLVYVSASHRVYGPAKGITASMQSASAASARFCARLRRDSYARVSLPPDASALLLRAQA